MTMIADSVDQFLQVCERKDWRWGVVGGNCKIIMPPKMMYEIHREVFGNDERAINRHSVRTYLTECGVMVQLDRCLSGCPPFYTASLLKVDYQGILPTLLVEGKEHWGDGLSWNNVEVTLFNALNVKLVSEKEMLSNWERSPKEQKAIDEWLARHP